MPVSVQFRCVKLTLCCGFVDGFEKSWSAPRSCHAVVVNCMSFKLSTRSLALLLLLV